MPNTDRRFFALASPGNGPLQVWCVEACKAYRVSMANPTLENKTLIVLNSPTDIQAQFENAFPNWAGIKLFEMQLRPGEYYARMARPIDQHPKDHGRFPTHSLYVNETAGTVGQIISLEGRLREICQIVEPSKKNLHVFGHSIRECLVIASMEVESHWKSVLRANGITKTRPTTNDYVLTLQAMKLAEYEVSFSRFPAVGPISPFSTWRRDNPTKSLPFYDAYNSVKHDRETAFKLGTLERAFEAVAACLVMAVAQFGYAEIFPRNRNIFEFFQLRRSPQWEPAECYTIAYEGWPPQETAYPF